MKKKPKIYKPDEFFWRLLRESNVKETMAKLILTSKNELSDEKLGLAEELTGSAISISDQAWEYFHKKEKITTITTYRAERKKRENHNRILITYKEIECMENEIWVPVKGYEEFYDISSFGRIISKQKILTMPKGTRRCNARLLNATKQINGYTAVTLSKSGAIKKENVHRLVLLSFVGAYPDGYEVCHNNGLRDDNKLSNLRWDTRSGNHSDKKRHGTSQEGERHGMSKLTWQQVKEIRASEKTSKDLAEIYQTDYSNICLIRRNKAWRKNDVSN